MDPTQVNLISILVIIFVGSFYGYTLGRHWTTLTFITVILYWVWVILQPTLTGSNITLVIQAIPSMSLGLWGYVVIALALYCGWVFMFYKLGKKHYNEIHTAKIDFLESMGDLYNGGQR